MRRIKFRKPYKLKNYRFDDRIGSGTWIIGILVVGSANESYQSKQILGVVTDWLSWRLYLDRLCMDYELLLILYGISVFMLQLY